MAPGTTPEVRGRCGHARRPATPPPRRRTPANPNSDEARDLERGRARGASGCGGRRSRPGVAADEGWHHDPQHRGRRRQQSRTTPAVTSRPGRPLAPAPGAAPRQPVVRLARTADDDHEHREPQEHPPRRHGVHARPTDRHQMTPRSNAPAAAQAGTAPPPWRRSTDSEQELEHARDEQRRPQRPGGQRPHARQRDERGDGPEPARRRNRLESAPLPGSPSSATTSGRAPEVNV